MCICLYVYVYMLCDKRHISQMLHGAGIFTYIEAPKMNQMKVNIPYMEHLGIQTWCVWCLYIYIHISIVCDQRHRYTWYVYVKIYVVCARKTYVWYLRLYYYVCTWRSVVNPSCIHDFNFKASLLALLVESSIPTGYHQPK